MDLKNGTNYQTSSKTYLESHSFASLFHNRNQKCLNFKDNLTAQARRYRKEIMMRLASVIWQAGLKDGTGLISTESGVLKETPYSVNPSFEGQPVTNPEELIAAALASSFSMALSTELDKDGLIHENIRTAAGLMMERLESGWIITQIHLEVRVKLLKGDLDKFEAAAKAAKASCTISRLLNTKITMDAKLESWGSFGKIARKAGSISLGGRLVTIPLREENEFSK